MTRTEIRTFVRDGFYAIAPTMDFGSGLLSFFNSNRSWAYPMGFHVTAEDPGDVSTNLDFSAPLDSWNIDLRIAKLGAMDLTPDEYEPLIDECDLIAQKLIYQYRNVILGYKKITMDSVRRTPFVKRQADCLVGIQLTFTINAPDQTSVC